jgi:hypothetical protein
MNIEVHECGQPQIPPNSFIRNPSLNAATALQYVEKKERPLPVYP